MKKYKFLLIPLAFLIPYLLIYQNFFSSLPLAWGDAPYFYQQNLNELFNKPFVWDLRNSNFGANQSLSLWLYLPTFLMGALNHFFKFSNEFLIRLIFYFPATILSFLGSAFFLKRYSQDKMAVFLGSFFYSFNSYFLLLIDGGQIGVALAYGIFPFVVALTLNFFNKRTVKGFLLSVGAFFILTNTDLRIAVLALFLSVLIKAVENLSGEKEKRWILWLPLIILTVASLDSFWLLPLILNTNTLLIPSSGLNLISLLDSLFLFEPHFPLNEFGTTFLPPFYYSFLLLLIIPAIFFIRKKITLFISLLFLLFVFLTKGGSDPLGSWYNFVVDKVPFASSFRDSSKFFAPLVLSAVTLLVFSAEFLSQKLTWRKYFFSVVVVYFYLLLLIFPAVFGSLSGSLGSQPPSSEYKSIYQLLSRQNGFFRTLWFPERPSLAFADFQKPAVSADLLYQERPFASQISGNYDLFYFLHSSQLKQWLGLLSVKYVFLPENQRKKNWTAKERIEREEFLKFANSVFTDKINTLKDFAGYVLDKSEPHIFGQKKIFVVVGGEDVYDNLIKRPNFNLAAQGFVFPEDAKFNLKFLTKISSDSAVLLFNNKTNDDLVMSFLKDKLISISKASFNSWGERESSDYLNWKNEMEKGGIKTKEFDFGKGIAFSSIPEEKINFDLTVPKDDNYFLAVRFTTASASAGIGLNFNNHDWLLKNNKPDQFKWQLMGPISLKVGQQTAKFKNNGGFVVLNTVGLIKQADLNQSRQEEAALENKFQVIKVKNLNDWLKVDSAISTDTILINSKQINPTLYKINLPPDVHWLVFNDRYDSGWMFGKSQSAPFYEMINGFYVDYPGEQQLSYKPQELVNKGMVVSLTSGIVLLLSSAVFLLWRKKNEN